MPAYVIVFAVPRADKSEEVARYSQTTAPLLVAAGGKVVFRGSVLKTLAGEDFAGIGIIQEFPDADAAAAFFAQGAYQALVPLRDEIFARLEIHILG